MQPGGSGSGGGRPPGEDPGRDPEPGGEPGGRTPVGYRAETWLFLGAAFLSVLLLFSVRCAEGPETARAYPSRVLAPEPKPVLLPPPPPSDEYFPCSDCHEDEPTDRTVRKLEDEHDELELSHGKLWCLDCHDADHRDELHLANEGRIPFEESWRLCTQCHGAKLADWRAGVHGKRMGSWWGPKEYWNCVACHDPHSPHFKPLEPKPPPVRPEQIRLAAPAAQEAAHEAP